MAATIIYPLPGVGLHVRLMAWLRGLMSRRLLLRLAGLDHVMLEGRVYVLRAVPLKVARELVPAMIRCSRRFVGAEIDEALYDDMVTVLALGLGTTPRTIERLTVPLWCLAPVLDAIAKANGIPVMEAGADPGKFQAAQTKSTGTSSTPLSSAVPGGPGITSMAA